MSPRKRLGMLAHPAEKVRIQRLGDKFYVQPKLNGVRAYVNWKGNTPTIYSSTGIPKQFLGHIRSELRNLPRLNFDGELYIHKRPWSYINSIASRTENPHPATESLEYHIFDIQSEYSQDTRITLLEEIRDMHKLLRIKIVPTYLISSSQWETFLTYFMDSGYEGIIFRAHRGAYAHRRSPNLLKFKPTERDVYKIVGLEQGTGWCYDRLGAFVVEGKDGSQFEIGTGPELTKERRLHYWQHKDITIGKFLLVKHETLKTANDLPVSAVALRILTTQEVNLLKSVDHDLKEFFKEIDNVAKT